jgi:DNA-binding CsgD family transcriptional regulator
MEPRVIETARDALAELEEYLAAAAAGHGLGAAHGKSKTLTTRERDVLALLADGRTTREVAAALCVSPHTVRSRIKSSLHKLGARTREHAIAIAIREGAVGPY